MGGRTLGDPFLSKTRLPVGEYSGEKSRLLRNIGPYPNARLIPPWFWRMQDGRRHCDEVQRRLTFRA